MFLNEEWAEEEPEAGSLVRASSRGRSSISLMNKGNFLLYYSSIINYRWGTIYDQLTIIKAFSAGILKMGKINYPLLRSL